MAFGQTEQGILRLLLQDPPKFANAKSLLALGANINAYDDKNTLLTNLMQGYPWDKVNPCQDCEHDIFDDACETCTKSTAVCEDGRHLPAIVQFFLDNGYDIRRHDGEYGGRALLCLSWASHDQYILEAARLLLAAGADPMYKFDGKRTVLDWMESQLEMAQRNENDGQAQLYQALINMMKGE